MNRHQHSTDSPHGIQQLSICLSLAHGWISRSVSTFFQSLQESDQLPVSHGFDHSVFLLLLTVSDQMAISFPSQSNVSFASCQCPHVSSRPKMVSPTFSFIFRHSSATLIPGALPIDQPILHCPKRCGLPFVGFLEMCAHMCSPCPDSLRIWLAGHVLSSAHGAKVMCSDDGRLCVVAVHDCLQSSGKLRQSTLPNRIMSNLVASGMTSPRSESRALPMMHSVYSGYLVCGL